MLKKGDGKWINCSGCYTIEQFEPIYSEVPDSADLFQILDTLQVKFAKTIFSSNNFFVGTLSFVEFQQYHKTVNQGVEAICFSFRN